MPPPVCGDGFDAQWLQPKASKRAIGDSMRACHGSSVLTHSHGEAAPALHAWPEWREAGSCSSSIAPLSIDKPIASHGLATYHI